jgi:DNA ligase-1
MTASEQAILEVIANYTLKKKKGYSDSLDDIDEKASKFKPMLAKKYEDYADKLDFESGVYSQPKLDGIRCIANKDGLWSRNGNQITSCPHIWNVVKKLFDADPSVVLDGELFSENLKEDFNTIVSLVKQQKPTQEDFNRSEKQIQYWIYDCFNKHNWPFGDRVRELVKFTSGILKSPYIKQVPTMSVHELKTLDKLYEEYLEAGMEGQMVRLDEKYEQKRSKYLLKRKETKDNEFTIFDIREGQGNRSGMAGYAVLFLGEPTDQHDERIFRANIKGDRAFLTELLKRRDEVIGKEATVEYFNLTPDGVPRFPRIKIIHETKRW